MVDYSQTKIYKIVCRQTGLVYIGATVQTLNERLRGHLTKKNCTSVQVLENGDYSIELIENFPCKTLQESNRREGHHIKNNECVNKIVQGRTNEEYNEDKKEQIIASKKRYQEENKEEIKEKNKVFYQDNKEEIIQKSKEYKERNKEEIVQKNKQYYEDNKEKISGKQKEYYAEHKKEILEGSKQYYENNKEKILERIKETYECECGTTSTIQHKARHNRSKKHQAYLATL